MSGYGRFSYTYLGVAVHEGDGQHDGLLGLGGLELEPAGRLVAGPVVEGPLEPLLAVGRIARRPVPYEGAQVLHKLVYVVGGHVNIWEGEK